MEYSANTIKFKDILKNGLLKGITTVWELLLIMVPTCIVVTFLKYTPVLPAIAKVCAPYMKYFGLRGEAALPLFIGIFASMYSGVGGMVPLGLTTKEITIMGVMLTTCHALIAEAVVLKKMGVSAFRISFLRLFLALIMGVILNLLIR